MRKFTQMLRSLFSKSAHGDETQADLEEDMDFEEVEPVADDRNWRRAYASRSC